MQISCGNADRSDEPVYGGDTRIRRHSTSEPITLDRLDAPYKMDFAPRNDHRVTTEVLAYGDESRFLIRTPGMSPWFSVAMTV